MSWSEFQKVLPQTARVGATGALEIGGCDTIQLAAEFGTPVYILDLAEVRDRLRRYRDNFGGYNVYYAAKVFLTKSFAKIVAEEDVGMDVLAGGELYVALSGGFPPERIAVHGNNKSRQELIEAVEAGVGRIVVDSFLELEMLRQITTERAVVQRVLLRVTPGIEAHTHDYLVTGVEDTKFGFTIGEVAMRAIEMVARSDNLELAGLHSHIGSQIFDLKPFEEAARKMVAFLGEARRATALEIPELNLGGGLGIPYLSSDEAGSIEDLAKTLQEAVESESEAVETEIPVLKVEPGRSIVGPAMLTLYTAGAVKELANGKRYVSIDGGMSDNIRPALYQAKYTFMSALRPEVPHDRETTIAGKLCETGDILGRDVMLPTLDPGEIVAVAATGAYGYAMSSHYNKMPKPAVVAVFGGERRVLARRETYEDLVRLD
jgi:diaminopimelate decarboxylase